MTRWRNGPIGIEDDELHKALYLRCVNAQLCAAITGLGMVYGAPSVDFVAQQLWNAGATKMRVEQVLCEFEGPIASQFRRAEQQYSVNANTTFVLGMIRYSGRFPRQKYEAGWGSYSALGSHAVLNIVESKSVSIKIHGALEAVDMFLVRRIRKMWNRGFFDRADKTEHSAARAPISWASNVKRSPNVAVSPVSSSLATPILKT
jgi:hypothetical protein